MTTIDGTKPVSDTSEHVSVPTKTFSDSDDEELIYEEESQDIPRINLALAETTFPKSPSPGKRKLV